MNEYDDRRAAVAREFGTGQAHRVVVPREGFSLPRTGPKVLTAKTVAPCERDITISRLEPPVEGAPRNACVRCFPPRVSQTYYAARNQTRTRTV